MSLLYQPDFATKEKRYFDQTRVHNNPGILAMKKLREPSAVQPKFRRGAWYRRTTPFKPNTRREKHLTCKTYGKLLHRCIPVTDKHRCIATAALHLTLPSLSKRRNARGRKIITDQGQNTRSCEANNKNTQ